MTLRLIIRTGLVSILAVTAATAQVKSGDGLGETVARRLADVFTEIDREPLTAVSLGEVGDAIASALSRVDATALQKLNDELRDLEADEADLRASLGDLARGLMLDAPGPVGPSLDGPVDESTVAAEEEELATLEGHLERMRRRRSMPKAEADELPAPGPTPFGLALLSSFDTLPGPAAEGIDPTPVVQSPFPDRLARALYRSGDHAGALRTFRAIDEGALTARDRYQMARCLEELGRVDEAIQALAGLTSAEGDGFWKERATRLQEFLEKSAKTKSLLRKTNPRNGNGN